MSLVYIGMPVYNGIKYIRNALESLINQTFTDWKLVISDNASKDNTPLVCEEYCRKDTRISYIRQKTNIGAFANFKYLLETCNSKYFMWAASDDEWDKSFIEACLNGLETSEEIGLSFTNIVNIDSFGRVIREYPSFKKYSYSDRYTNITNFVLDPECLGKANLFYGIYKIKKLKAFMIGFLSSQESKYCAFDVALNLGILCRVGLSIDERVLFKKRYTRPSDKKININYHTFPQFPILESFTFDDFKFYKKAILAASIGTEYEKLVSVLMEYREKLVEEINLYDLRKNKMKKIKSILKTCLPNSLINFIKNKKNDNN